MENVELLEPRTDLSALQETVQRLKAEVRKIIVGQQHMVELLTAAVLAEGHVLIEGVPGVAKTLAAKLLAKTLDVGFARLQFTPDLMPSDVLGTMVYNLQKSEFEFKRGPIFSNLVLVDEINRAPAKTQAALFEVMEERQVTIDGVTHPMARPFFVVATQNPIEHEGTYRLPEAQLDRFFFKIAVDYPSFEEETTMLAEFHARKNVNDLNAIMPVLRAEQIAEQQQQVKAIHVEPNLLHYIAKIAHQTRNDSAIYLGASPRAALTLMTAAKAIAAIRGRDFITPEDIREMALPVLRHRIMLTPEKEMEGVKPDEVLQQLLARIEVPR